MRTTVCTNCQAELQCETGFTPGEHVECPGCQTVFVVREPKKGIAVVSKPPPPPTSTLKQTSPVGGKRKPRSAIAEAGIGIGKAAAVLFLILAGSRWLYYELVEKPGEEKRERQANVVPLNIALQDATVFRGVGGNEYNLVFLNRDKEQWRGDLSVRIENAAGERVARGHYKDIILRPDKSISINLRGRAGDRVHWVCSTEGKTVAEGASRIIY